MPTVKAIIGRKVHTPGSSVIRVRMKPGVRVLHRATADDYQPTNVDRAARPGNDGDQLQQLLAENESLKQRLEQVIEQG